MAILDSKHKKKAILFTAIILIAFVWGIFSFGLRYQDPPIEYGIAINFGTSTTGNNKPKLFQNLNYLFKTTRKPLIAEEVVEEISNEIPNDEILTQNENTTLIQKPKEDAEPTPKKPSKNTLKLLMTY